MALLSFRGFYTPSLPAQGEQRRSSYFNINRDIPGSKVPSARFRIRSLNVGGKIVENVTAVIALGEAEILLGQSFLSRFKSWSVDNQRHVLKLE